MQAWVVPLAAVIIYPGFLLTFDAAINSYYATGNPFTAGAAVLMIVLARRCPL
jgi:hypothetical protein